jgi:anti-anti-sigma factor
MSARTDRQPGTARHTWQVLWIGGEIDIATGDYLRAVLQLVDDPHRDVVLDLSDVTFMDCGGIRPLLEAQRRLGDRLWLTGLRPPVTRLLELTGLSPRFAVLAEPVSSLLLDGHSARADYADLARLRLPRPRKCGQW